MLEPTAPNPVAAQRWAWVAGLFEAEGSLIVPNGRGGSRRLDITNTDREVLERVQVWTDMGSITEDAKPRPRKRKPRLVWQITRWAYIESMGFACFPYLGGRRRAALRRLFERPPTRPVLRVVDGMLVRTRLVEALDPRTNSSAPTAEAWMAWAAGLFEGEGSAICRPAGGRRRGFQRRLQLPMTDRDVLERFAAVVGAGTVRATKKAKTSRPRKQGYIWTTSRWSHIERIAGLFYPWLSAKRRAQVDALLSNPPFRGGNANKLFCLRGHPLTGPDAQIYLYGNARECKQCKRARYEEARVERKRLGSPPVSSDTQRYCKRGHPLLGPDSDVYWYLGWPQCRACDRERNAARRARSRD